MKTCTIHHYACDCREARIAWLVDAARAVTELWYAPIHNDDWSPTMAKRMYELREAEFDVAGNKADASEESTAEPALTKREQFAKAAMQGMIASPGGVGSIEGCVRYAVRYADALIAALNKEEAPQ